MILKYLKSIKVTITPLSLVLLLAVGAGLIYTSIYVVRIILGVNMPAIPDSYIEDQVKSSFETSKFNAKIEDPKIEKNLFNPERRTQKRIALVTMMSNTQLVLYGTFISPGLQMAYMEDTGNPLITSSGERRQQVLKKGDAISGFVLTEIYPEKVMLVRNNEKIYIQLSENKPDVENAENQPPTNPRNPK